MWTIFLLLFLINSSVWAQQDPHSLWDLSRKADGYCMDLRSIGICPKPTRDPPIGIKLQFWQPKIIIETVKNPGDYTIQEYGAILQSAAKKTAEFELKSKEVSSGSSSGSLHGGNLQFNEVHIYNFPSEPAFDALCSDEPNLTMGIRYLSEADSLEWRKGNIERNLPQSAIAPRVGPQCSILPVGTEGQCMGAWGPLYPRTGFVIQGHPTIASLVDTLRAISIAGDPLALHHIVESRLNFSPNLPIDKVQMVYPAQTKCFSIGQKDATLQRTPKDGHYVWIFWHRRTCCA